MIDLYDMYDSHYMIQQKAQIIDKLFDVYIKHLDQNKKISMIFRKLMLAD